MKPLILALDVDSEKEVKSIVKATRKHVDIYKVGPPLILRYGTDILKTISKGGKKIFLDMKFHDIPNTMERSIREAAKCGIFSATVHTSAGESALKAVAAIKPRPQIWGVTVLTSLTSNDLHQLGFDRTPIEQAWRLAEMAKHAKIDGIVASVGETAELRRFLGPAFTIVTPGIRMPEGEVGDQKRVATPSHARAAGATYIVVGRPIVEAKDPAQAAEDILRDWKR